MCAPDVELSKKEFFLSSFFSFISGNTIATSAAFLPTTNAILRSVACVQRDEFAGTALWAGAQPKVRACLSLRFFFAHFARRIGCLRVG